MTFSEEREPPEIEETFADPEATPAAGAGERSEEVADEALDEADGLAGEGDHDQEE